MNLRSLLFTAALASSAATSQAAEFAPLLKRWVPLASCAMSGCSEFQIVNTVDMDTVPDGTLVNASVVWRSNGPDGTHLGSTLEYVFCSKSHPTVFNYTKTNDPALPDWSKTNLDPGAFSNESPTVEAQYQLYYAVCHATAPKDVFDKGLAARLGYHFSQPFYGEDKNANINPIDFLRDREADPK